MAEHVPSEKALEIAKEIAKDVYTDAGRPIAKPTGELVGLLPRAVKAALAPLEKWVLQREYNVAETKKLLEEKLQNVPPELITQPEAHVAVPALQYISYCMDNDELRDMYANLLANSMNSIVKNGVHPGFVEVIKQLSPDEAKILKCMQSKPTLPTISLRVSVNNGGTKTVVNEFSDLPFEAGCENPLDSEKCFDNLVRLGLVERKIDSLTDKKLYEPLKNHEWVKDMRKRLEMIVELDPSLVGFNFGERYIRLSAFGESFCEICLGVKGNSGKEQGTAK
ncbi:MAG: DUF4393 domain-containing protein [Oscillospiraceae bacterium]|nr:DUF4393 domain-containing protein [Oscillospiraceae bacterium]